MFKPVAKYAGSVLAVLMGLTPGVQAQHKPAPQQGACASRGEDFVSRPGPVTAVWANSGGDKVTAGELRTVNDCRRVRNRTWNGSQVLLFGAANETVSFNIILEAANHPAEHISVSFDRVVSATGYEVKAGPQSPDTIFDWRSQDIALYFVRYLRIQGLSAVSYDTYDERHIPERMRRPYSGEGEGHGSWTDRPDHDALYPDIAVPIALMPRFTIEAGTNQSIWADIYIPKGTPQGLYEGTFAVEQNGRSLYTIPVTLDVMPFAISDKAAVRAFAATSYDDIAARYTRTASPAPHSAQDQLVQTIAERQAQLAQRHRIELIDNNGGAGVWQNKAPRPYWLDRLTGALFTAERGYRGPGEGSGTSVFSIGTFGVWQSWWNANDAKAMWRFTDAWETWFRIHAPHVDRFLYLADEPDDLDQVERWASLLKSNNGPGGSIATFTTTNLLDAVQRTPSADIIASLIAVGDTGKWEDAIARLGKSPRRQFMLYNGQRPATGSFAIEDDGVALRQLAWAQYKKRIPRWFYWEATYYDDYQGGRGPTDVFKTAQTFGGAATPDPVLGLSGWNSSNGDGVLMYPGTDAIFPHNSYNAPGPFASLRLKHWRRGIEDVAYIRLAERIDPEKTSAIVARMVPKVLWEYGVADPADPTWIRTDISWSTDPDTWEAARAELADIILKGKRED